MQIGIWQVVIIIVLALLLFGGKGKISSIMGDFAGGIKAFRKGMSEDDKKLENKTVVDVTPAKEAEKAGHH